MVTLEFSEEFKEQVEKAEHVLYVVSKSDNNKQSGEAFSKFADKLIELKGSEKAISIVTTGYLYAFAYYELENPGKSASLSEIQEAAIQFHKKWTDENKDSLMRLENAGIKVTLLEFSSFINRPSYADFCMSLFEKIKSSHKEAYAKHLTDVANIFIKLKRKELYRQGIKLKNEQIRQAVEKFLELEVKFSSYMRYLTQLDADHSDFLDIDVEVYPSAPNSLFKYMFSKLEDSKAITWCSYDAKMSSMSQNDTAIKGTLPSTHRVSAQGTMSVSSGSSSVSSSDSSDEEGKVMPVSPPGSPGLSSIKSERTQQGDGARLKLFKPKINEQKQETSTQDASVDNTLNFLFDAIISFIDEESCPVAIKNNFINTICESIQNIFNNHNKDTTGLDFLCGKIREIVVANCMKDVKLNLINSVKKSICQMFNNTVQDDVNDAKNSKDKKGFGR